MTVLFKLTLVAVATPIALGIITLHLLLSLVGLLIPLHNVTMTNFYIT